MPDFDLTPLTNYLEKVAPRGRTMLLPALHHAQALYGWLPREVQDAISRGLRVPAAEVHGVVEFYSMFSNTPQAQKVFRLCNGPVCQLAGADAVSKAICEHLEIAEGGTTPDNSITFERAPCLGLCDNAPSGVVGETPVGALTPQGIAALLKGDLPPVFGRPFGGPRHLLKRVGWVDPASLSDYEAHGGYQGLRKAIAMPPEALADLADQTGILGRGGAMFPLGRKLEFTRNAPGSPAEKHIVVNADEAEPGTFKDRYLLEEDPFSVVEAATLSAFTVGAENGWVFIRGEYPRAAKRMQTAIDAARAAGFLGRDILGVEGFNFDLEIRLGAGAYICGEETALFEAIEGKRGYPRIKPPFPVTHGLFNQPTAINNVETLAAFLAVVNAGLDEWKSLGTEKSPGTKLFCLCGDVEKPGVYEVPFGLTIRELLEKAGVGSVQAVLVGGAAGVFIGPEKLDTPLTYEDCKAAGIPIGSGVVMVFDESADLREVMYQLAWFFAHESCGKCFPCRLGTRHQMDILEKIAQNGGGTPPQKLALHDIGHAMTQTSLCGLGQTAAKAVLSALERWPELIS